MSLGSSMLLTNPPKRDLSARTNRFHIVPIDYDVKFDG
jgi:hypothetical protein